MGYARGTALGDWFHPTAAEYTWTDYISGRPPAPNGVITSPEGDVYRFDANGKLILGPVTNDATVETNPASQFYGWTELQKAALVVAMGGQGILTDALRATGTFVAGSNVMSYSAADVAANNAKLVAIAQSDPTVAAALASTAGGQGVVTPYGAAATEALAVAAQAASAAELDRTARAALAGMIAAGGLFTDTLSEGSTYDDAVLVGMISTQQWLDDFKSAANGGRRTNAIAAAGKIPASVTPHTYAALPPTTPWVDPPAETFPPVDPTSTVIPTSGPSVAVVNATGFELSTPVLLAAAAAAVLVVPSLLKKRTR